MCTQKELQDIIKRMGKIYLDIYGDNVVKIFLYGSYARGDFNADSDIDIVAIVRGERKKLQQDLKKIWDRSADLELEYGAILSPTVIPFDEFERYRSVLPYYQNISKEGVEIVA